MSDRPPAPFDADAFRERLEHPASAPFAPERRRAVVLSVHDGDTVDIALLQEPPISVRIVGIDAPELSTEVGPAARQYLDHLIGGKVVEVSLTGKMSFGRFLADVSIDGLDISQAMLEAGHARPMGPHGEHLPDPPTSPSSPSSPSSNP